MATPEERKSKLQAAWRAQRASALSNLGNPNSEFAKSQADDRARIRAKQKRHDAEIRARVAAKAPELFAPKRQRLNDFRDVNTDTTQPELEQEEQQVQQIQQAQRLAGIQAGMNAQTQQAQAQNQKSQQADEETRKQREEVQKVAKAAFQRGAIWVTNLLAGVVDSATGGISFVVDILVYLFTLGWLNLEMIYGRYFMKGKSKYVGPLSWDPIPMPIDKEAVILTGFVVAADIALGVAILVFSFGGFCIIHDYVKITDPTTAAMQVGTALAQGQSGGLCLGGIITSALGL